MIPQELQILLDKKKWDESITYIEKYDKPLNEYLLDKLGWCYSRLKKYNEAINVCDQLIKLQPQKAKWRYTKGYQFYMKNDWQAAVDNFNKALELYPEYFIVKYRLAYALLQLAGKNMQWSKDTFWKAIKQLEDCHSLYANYGDEDKIKQKSDYANICALHGKTIGTSPKHTEKAIKLLTTSLELKDDYDTKYQLAKVYHLNKDFDKALSILPKEKEDRYYVLELRADILADNGNVEESNKVLLNLIKFRNKDYDYRKIAENYLELQQYSKAEEYALMALSKGQNNHINHYVCGKVYNAKKQNKTSIKYLQTASELKQKNYNSEYIEAIQLKDSILQQTCNNPTDTTALIVTKQELKKQNSGTITHYNDEKGFGFIHSNEIHSRVFFHVKQCKNEFKPTIGLVVVFDTEESSKGIEAKNVIKREGN